MVILLLINLLFLTSHMQALVDFKESLFRSSEIYNYELLENTSQWQVYIYLYQNYQEQELERKERTRIPKIIHQIWLGSALPERYKKFQNSWISMHPEWKYILWTEKEIEEFKLVNKESYDKASNFGEKSDIARYEILYRLGGLYVDTDFECIKPFDILHENFDFFAGFPGWCHFILNNALIASEPGNIILKYCIEKVPAYSAKSSTLERTGPYFFTDCFCEMALKEKKSKIIVFPGSYFYAFPPYERLFDKSPSHAARWCRPESFAIHYWDSSWSK